jgi:putative CocE/NonD family hydrolase
MSDLALERRAAVVVLLLLAGVGVAGFGARRYDAAPQAKRAGARAFEVAHAMIPMRDGVKLETVILTPKARSGPLPIVLVRTPYGVDDSEPDPSGFWSAMVNDGYILVRQSIRGRFKSDGTFVMTRPVRDRGDPNAVDESTDAYDAIEWLVHNVPGNSGRVGTVGISYSGWTAAMSLVDPHPALKCASEQASPADMFLNDDFHHLGAFRLSYGFEYSFALESEKEKNSDFDFDRADLFDWYLGLGSLAHADEHYFHGKVPTWEDFTHHPNYDDYWKARAVGRSLVRTLVPNLNVAGWWDQEDFVGPIDIYERLEKSDAANLNYLVVGPWNHGGWAHGRGRSLGVVDFGSDTGVALRDLQARWFAHWLHDAPLDLPEATIFETGSNTWQRLDSWPPRSGVTTKRLYFGAGRTLSFDPPADAGEAFDAYLSDPANPVPYRHRPIGPTYPGPEWTLWLLEDQRFVDHRPDVLTWETAPLDRDVVLRGDVAADLYATTTGSDADWAVKLIDVYPDAKPPAGDAGAGANGEAEGDGKDAGPDMRGYELIIADDILRGRFRNSFEQPEPVAPGAVVHYRVDLHTAAHAFLRGHRIMVQVQSTWFPLYDRNPQKFVENIYQARDEDFVVANHRVYRSREAPSSVSLAIAQ